MGTIDSFRSPFHYSLFVDRSVLRHGPISLPGQRRAAPLFEACRRRDHYRRNLLLAFSTTLRLWSSVCGRLDRRALPLVSRVGCAVQSCSLTACRAALVAGRSLREKSEKTCAVGRDDLVRSCRTFAGADLPTSHHRHHCRLRARRILLLFLSRTSSATRRHKKSPDRRCLCDWRADLIRH